MYSKMKGVVSQLIRLRYCRATVAEQRASNIHVKDGVLQAEFVARRQARDATLDLPALMLPSV